MRRIKTTQCVECPIFYTLTVASKCETCRFGSGGKYGESGYVECTFNEWDLDSFHQKMAILDKRLYEIELRLSEQRAITEEVE